MQSRSLSESRHISTASTPEFKRACNATVELHGQFGSYNEVIGYKFWYLVVILAEYLMSARFYNRHTHHSHKTRLQILGHLPAIGQNPPRYYAPSLKWMHPPESENCPHYRKRP
ncbi:hypothetical protein M9H77_28267 [Catharanthus roseus]|uniref:Uncharacterized protein n=1 Tax=Catharanthus roseus TaxID=4058 RepID=A0ACC0AH47_CATRO|nr:hypothetical protein M9H77_28267 [Catharanthus roseus]